MKSGNLGHPTTVGSADKRRSTVIDGHVIENDEEHGCVLINVREKSEKLTSRERKPKK